MPVIIPVLKIIVLPFLNGSVFIYAIFGNGIYDIFPYFNFVAVYIMLDA